MAGPPPQLAPLLRGRRGYLATIGPDGSPHLIPVCFTWAGDVIWTAIDSKPKSTDELQRLKDVARDPRTAFIVDRWDEDWSKLSWLQARGAATVIEEGAEVSKTRAALKDKYPQYRDVAVEGPVIRIDVDRWIGWSAAGPNK